MSSIKKAFVELHTFLEANKDKKVNTIMEEVTAMSSAKGAGGAASASVKDADGNVVGILDYYFKTWLPVAVVPFGAKANSATGFNTMCKLGVSHWTKQQRDYKKGKEDLLDKVAAGEIEPTAIQEELDKLEAARNDIAAFPVPECAFESSEALLEANTGAMQAAWDAYEAAQVAATEEAANETEEDSEAA